MNRPPTRPERRPRRVKFEPRTGQVFGVPLLDGRYGLAQLAHVVLIAPRAYSLTAGFFPHTAGSLDELSQLVQRTELSSPFAVVSITQSVIREGEWKLLGEAPSRYVNVDVPSRIRGTLALFDDFEIDPDWILDMYHGNYPWDGFYDPLYVDKLLLPGQTRPASARLRKDFTPERLTELGV